MGLKYFLLGTSLCFGLIISPASSNAASDLAPRAEVSVKGGSERSTLTTEFWAPLAQQSHRVVYTDLRLMGDDDDNREGNLGIGYRQIYEPTNSVLGIHGWIDRRRTEHNSTFHQVTLGLESLGDKIDLRANGYIPLNSAHTITTPNLGQPTPYLAGSGIFYDTTGSISETPQYGLDAEAGYRLPIFEKQVDTVRVFGGGYYFFRDNTDSVLGFRVRTESQINRLVSIGARFQYDASRGSQGFLEATLRFPFSAKKLYQTDKLRSRLDESPERDIDIVTASKVDTGLHKEITNTATGQSQRILYVDNTQTNGDGTKEHPFNNLQSAQAALQANDILYIFRGDGTARNMDQGITIDKPGVQLIGSGSPLTISGITFLNAGAAPVISNNYPSTNGSSNLLGDGILVTADNASIFGVTITDTQKHGIYFSTPDNTILNNFTVDNVRVISTINTNNNYGIYIVPQNGGTLLNASVTNSTFSGPVTSLAFSPVTNGTLGNAKAENLTMNNNGRGILVFAGTGTLLNTTINNINITNSFADNIFITSRDLGHIGDVAVSNITSSNDTAGAVIRVTASNNSSINKVTASNFSANNTQGAISVDINNSVMNQFNASNFTSINNITGITIQSQVNGIINELNLSNFTINNSTQRGAYFKTATGASIGSITVSNGTATNSSLEGLRVESNGAGSTIGRTNITNVISSNNTQYGAYILGISAGTISNMTLSNVTTNNNALSGVYVLANAGTVNNTNILNHVSNNNIQNGIIAGTLATAQINGLNIINTIANNNTISGVNLNANAGSINNSVLANVTASNNTGQGILVQAATNATIDGLQLSAVKANNNSQNGIQISTSQATSIIRNVSVFNSDMTGNGVNGIYLLRSNAAATLVADLGGGAYNSIGQNRIFGNTTKDIQVNYTGGGAVFAKSNWWGINTGLNQGTRATLSASTTIDSTTFLTIDPRP